jgi:hypothetical protein
MRDVSGIQCGQIAWRRRRGTRVGWAYGSVACDVERPGRTCRLQRHRHPVVFVVDAVAVSGHEHPILVLDLNAGVDAGPFRAPPRQVQAIQNNLSLANMDYVDFTRATGADGVFRGF